MAPGRTSAAASAACLIASSRCARLNAGGWEPWSLCHDGGEGVHDVLVALIMGTRRGERERESPSKCMDSREEQYMMTLMALGSSPSRRQSSKALSYLPALVPHEHLHPLYQLGSAKQHGPGQPLLGIGRVHRTFAIVVVRWEGRRADEHRGGQACEHHLTGRASSCMQGRYMQRLVRGDI